MMWGRKWGYYAAEYVRMEQNAVSVYLKLPACHSFEKDCETSDRVTGNPNQPESEPPEFRPKAAATTVTVLPQK
jgi:hypothetical protein